MSYDHQRATYWFARVAEKLGEKEVSQELYCELAAKIPEQYCARADIIPAKAG